MIPEEKKPLVVRALQVAFGVTEYENIEELTAGLSSARIFKIVVKSKAYLLRIIMRTDDMADPGIHFSCMKSAEQAAVAPHIRYASIKDRIAITDFIEAKPFAIGDALVMMPSLLRRLHAVPAFPFRLNYFEAVDGFIKKFREANLLTDSITEPLFRNYEKINQAYPRDFNEWVSCHNDLKPDNIIFDGSRPWLVDLEAVFLNDRFVDLTIIANFVLRQDDDEERFLTLYFGSELTDYHRARFFLMRQIMHIAYLSMFMFLGAGGKPVDPLQPRHSFREFHDLVWNRDITLEGAANRLEYGLVHLDQLQYNLQTARVKESIQIVGAKGNSRQTIEIVGAKGNSRQTIEIVGAKGNSR